MPEFLPSRSLRRLLTGALLALFAAAPAYAIDLIPDLFKKEKVKATIWEQNEQYVRLVQIESNAPLNDHPVAIDGIELEQAFASLQLWIEGGVLRDAESVAVYPRKQAALITPDIVEALSKAAPDEDVTFNIRGYSDSILSVVRVREWTTGRVFHRDGKVNLIIGEHRKRIDKAKKNVEGAFGVIDDFRDVHFQVGSRSRKGRIEGRIVTTDGVEPGAAERPDWVVIDVARAALAYRDAQVPTDVRKSELKAKAAAAKLTLERRQMREEMARMRKELQDMQKSSGGATLESLEDRLSKLQQLKDKGLISDEDFVRRKEQILGEI